MRFAIFALSAVFSGIVSAVTTPVGQPKGNAIVKPELGEIVPAGKPYEITWVPDTPGTVTLLLLRGPSENVVPIGAPIVEKIPNTGKFTWTPGYELEPDTLRYGIQLIVDATGQYQYSVQFGISNDKYGQSPSSTPAGPSATASSSSVVHSGYPSPSNTEEPSKYPPTTTAEVTTTHAPPPPVSNTTCTTTTTSSTSSEVPIISTTKAPEPTTAPPVYRPTTLLTTTVDVAPSTSATVKPSSPANGTFVPPPSEGAASSMRVIDAATAFIAVAVAGFALL